MTETVCCGRDNPCKGCLDRYPACSGHCEKPAYLKWKAEQAKIRENRKKYNGPIWCKEEPFRRVK